MNIALFLLVGFAGVLIGLSVVLLIAMIVSIVRLTFLSFHNSQDEEEDQ